MISTMRFYVGFYSFAAVTLPFVASHPGPKCPIVDKVGRFQVPFFPAFTEYVQDDDDDHNLYITSISPPGPPPLPGVPPPPSPPPNLVARITNIDEVEEEGDSFVPAIDILADTNIVWPNDIALLPNDIFPFPALLVPQGFLLSLPGRLTAINLNKNDAGNYDEYVIHQSSPGELWFYHNAVFHDMDGDDLLDIITVRSNANFLFPPLEVVGQLVWFKNPGEPYSTTGQWEERILFSGIGAPDILVQMADFDGDEVPEFVATSFFSVGVSDYDVGTVTLFGAPEEGWSTVDATDTTAPTVRTKVLVDDQGKPFGLEIVDLNGDKRPDLLMTNHQTSDSSIDGRVFAVEQPSSGDIFAEDNEWPIHNLMDGIRPTVSPIPGQFRLAPGFAKAIYPFPGKGKRRRAKPWILVGGDQASKVWLLSPTNEEDWDYTNEIIIDIKEEYGSTDYVSTIGEQVGVKSLEEQGEVIIYIPVFEAQEIFVYRLKNGCDGQGCRHLRGSK